ncbi:MAG: hypothetical protein ACTHQQ_17450 [Solirubrobacteraceae bacterium]
MSKSEQEQEGRAGRSAESDPVRLRARRAEASVANRRRASRTHDHPSSTSVADRRWTAHDRPIELDWPTQRPARALPPLTRPRDLAHVDADGYLFLQGGLDTMINTSYHVYPEEVERR